MLGRRRWSQSMHRWGLDWCWGWEQSGTHVGARQPGSSMVGHDTQGPNGRAAVRSGGQPGDGKVGRTAGRRAVGHTHGGRIAGQR
jgi:hypothetical protein